MMIGTRYDRAEREVNARSMDATGGSLPAIDAHQRFARIPLVDRGSDQCNSLSSGNKRAKRRPREALKAIFPGEIRHTKDGQKNVACPRLS
jgi:hypothetical protein